MSIFQQIAELEKEGKPFVLCEIVSSSGSTPRHAGSKMLVFEDGKIIGTVGGGQTEYEVIKEALASLKDRKIRKLHYTLVNPEKGDPGVCGGQLEVYVEPIIPKLTVVIIGAGHVGKQVAHLCKWLDYRVVISDEREELCNPESIPDADEYLVCSMSDLPKKFTFTKYTYVVLSTSGSKVDVDGLPSLLKTNAGYIGAIGSRRRWEFTKKGLLEKGVKPEAIATVHSPIGLELQAETPEEIAISILAELIMAANGGSGKHMDVK